MKKRMLCIVAIISLLIAASIVPSYAVIMIIGDNDGYGYGDSSVPDGADLPTTADPMGTWVFDNRDAAELAAADGSQYTDWEPYAQRDFSFTISGIPETFSATFSMDVSGIQESWFGASSLYLDGDDYSSMLPYDQGPFGSGLLSTSVDVALLTDGALNVHFLGSSADHIAFDYFCLEVNEVPEPTSLIILGTGFLGFLGFGKRKRTF